MKYLVMECHLSYAVVLDEEGRFLKVANRHYEVGQTVTDVMEMQIPETVPVQKRLGKWMYSLAAAAACLVLAAGSAYRLGQATYVSVYMEINPEVRIDVNRKDVVVGLDGVNEDGTALIDGYTYKRKELELVMDELVDRAVDMGYLYEGGRITLTLDTEHEEWVEEHSDALAGRLNERLSETMAVTIEIMDSGGQSRQAFAPTQTAPEKPAGSGKAEKPAGPTKPADPAGEKEPAGPGAAEGPAGSGKAESSTGPTKPVGPGKAESPAGPTKPAAPGKVEEPASPTKPTDPGTAEELTAPTKPVDPAGAGEPVGPGAAGEPAAPTKPADPDGEKEPAGPGAAESVGHVVPAQEAGDSDYGDDHDAPAVDEEDGREDEEDGREDEEDDREDEEDGREDEEDDREDDEEAHEEDEDDDGDDDKDDDGNDGRDD